VPTNLLLLPLLGGYWFLHTLYYTRFRSQRLDGYRLLLESAIAGVFFSLVARCCVAILARSASVIGAWNSLSPRDVPFLGTACGAFLLGFGSPYLLNWACPRITTLSRFSQTEAQFRAISRHGNHMLRLVHTAAREERPVSVTLDNRKCYVGIIVDAPNLEAHDAFLSLVPWFSGFRDKDTLGLVFGVDYLRVYDAQHLDPYQFRVVVPISNIRMISFFDPSVYPAFVVEEESREPAGDALEPAT
jgi:hypothetical protein